MKLSHRSLTYLGFGGIALGVLLLAFGFGQSEEPWRPWIAFTPMLVGLISLLAGAVLGAGRLLAGEIEKAKATSDPVQQRNDSPREATGGGGAGRLLYSVIFLGVVAYFLYGAIVPIWFPDLHLKIVRAQGSYGELEQATRLGISTKQDLQVFFDRVTLERNCNWHGLCVDGIVTQYDSSNRLNVIALNLRGKARFGSERTYHGEVPSPYEVRETLSRVCDLQDNNWKTYGSEGAVGERPGITCAYLQTPGGYELTISASAASTPLAPGSAIPPTAAAPPVTPVSSGAPARHGNQPTYQYEPAIVTLRGQLTYFASEDVNGRKINVPAVRLESPISVQASDINERADDVEILQMVLSSPEQADAFREFTRQFTNNRVSVTGQLSHQMTAHHYTKVLITASRISPAN